MTDKELLKKFIQAPGLLSVEELNIVRKFLDEFEQYFKVYQEVIFRQYYDGICYNEITAEIKRVDWYINFKEKQDEDN